MKFAAFIELLKRYVRVTRLAWGERAAHEGPRLEPHEAEFLPAALALRDSPIHPAPRVLAWVLLSLIGVTLVWSIFGQIDIVATAQGKFIPDDRSKVVQPMETAVVRAIHVRDGQVVKAGELLIELDATETRAENIRVGEAHLASRLESARAQALLEAIRLESPPRLSPLESVDSLRLAAEQRLLEGEYGALSARLAQFDAQILRREAELRAVDEMVAKLRETLPIVQARAQDYQRLLNENFVSRHGWLEKEQARIEQERDLAAQREKQTELRTAIQETRRERAALVAETRRATLDRLHEAQKQAATLSQDQVKAANRDRLTRLMAPVSGVVQQLAVHTVGGVVTPAQPLLVIVPEENPLEVEAFVQNKDIGFVRVGQPAEVKVETFPFTKYGALPGVITQISSDAIQDEKMGLVYAARVKPERTSLEVDGKRVRLSPGMAVTAEIKTGQRRAIEFFLTPLLQYQQESLRER
ncbi:MAG: HlyD family type I secretion periplasmic adaptor subunit [Betaproteobacteria bacterium]|nr:HlyD family type I secretion periplasmic adaptor subunit [Betaproteobacteria bacterium]